MAQKKKYGNPAKNAERQAREARLHGTTLSKSDSDMFFHMFMPLLMFTDDKLHVVERDSMTVDGKKIVSDYHESLFHISQELWKHPSVFDEFIESEEGQKLTEEQKAIVLSWKRVVFGSFAVVRNQENGSVLVDIETKKVYRVKGLVDSIEYYTRGFDLPVVLKMALLPFKDVIITSGHVAVAYTEIAADAERIYQDAKANGTIIKELV